MEIPHYSDKPHPRHPSLRRCRVSLLAAGYFRACTRRCAQLAHVGDTGRLCPPGQRSPTGRICCLFARLWLSDTPRRHLSHSGERLPCRFCCVLTVVRRCCCSCLPKRVLGRARQVMVRVTTDADAKALLMTGITAGLVFFLPQLIPSGTLVADSAVFPVHVFVGVPGSGKRQVADSFVRSEAAGHLDWRVVHQELGPSSSTVPELRQELQAALLEPPAAGRERRFAVVGNGVTSTSALVSLLASLPSLRVATVSCCVDVDIVFVEGLRLFPRLLSQSPPGFVSELILTARKDTTSPDGKRLVRRPLCIERSATVTPLLRTAPKHPLRQARCLCSPCWLRRCASRSQACPRCEHQEAC